jgi:hypothetical protein
MASRPLLRFRCLAAVLLCILAPGSRAQAPKTNVPLTLEDVVELTKQGVAEDVIITKIRMNGKPFDLNAAEIVELKKLGINDLIVNYLLDPAFTPKPPPPPPSPSRPDTPAPPPVAAGPPPKHYAPDDYASKVPPEPGLYRFPAEAPVAVDIRILLGTKEGAGLGKVLLKKGKIIAYLVGPAAKTRIKDAAPVFYMRLPEGKAIEEVVLVALDRKPDRRELEMGPPGPKPELKAESRRPFDALEVGSNLFKLTSAKLAKGEYLFFQLGSAEPPKGSYGKGFDFGIDEASQTKK